MLRIYPGPFENWVLGLFPEFHPQILNIDYYVEKRNIKRDKNISLGDRERMPFEIRTFSVSLSHTTHKATYTLNYPCGQPTATADAQLAPLSQMAPLSQHSLPQLAASANH